ncbi:hypothetical protein ES708_25356 [subsurface metagenome]
MILITGGTGLVGSHLLYELVKKKLKVRVLKRSTGKTENVLETFRYYSDNPEELFSKIEWVEGDVSGHNLPGRCHAGCFEGLSLCRKGFI